MDSNQLDHVLSTIGSSLQYLTIDGIQFELNKSIEKLTQIKSCHFNQFHAPPTNHLMTFLSQSKHMTYLNLTGFKIDYSKPLIQSLPRSLRCVCLEGTINNLPTFIRIEKFTFVINGHQPTIISSVDTSLWRETLLELSIIGNPQFNGPISENISKLTKLEKLVLTGIGFDTIPKRFYSLKQLKHLDLSNNNISKISKKIAYMQSLQYLDFSRNHVKSFDVSILKLMKQLDHAIIQPNPFCAKYKTMLSYQNWVHYPTYNTITTQCRIKFIGGRRGMEVLKSEVTWFIEYYKHVRFTILIEYEKNGKKMKKEYKCAMDKKYCQLYEWEVKVE